MKAQWYYLHNTFLSATNSSYKKALILFEDTQSKLKAEAPHDAGIQDMFNDFAPFYEAYRDLYSQKTMESGAYEGSTLNFENVIAEIVTHIRVWEGKVRAEFPEDSAEERAIFPNKRTPFNTGSYEERISAVKSLYLQLDKYPVLASVKLLVETYYNRLLAARTAQQEQEGQNDKLSTLLEAQRVKTCTELYGILMRLCYKYRNTPDRVLDYFDLSLIRSSNTTGGASMLTGKVVNKSGTGLNNSTVRVPEIGVETMTDNNGAFMLELEAGKYDVEVLAPGYTLFKEYGIEFEKDKKVEKIFVLE